jgi:hypothetical protein
MSVYLVTWNLNKERANYDRARREFVAHLETIDHTKDAGLESVRWISTASTATAVQKYLRQKMDDNDRLFVTKLNRGEHAGWISKSIWTWIDARV